MFRDHKGHEFHTFKDMCEFWNLKVPTVKKRMDLHWSLESALTTSPNKNIEIIYKGVTYFLGALTTPDGEDFTNDFAFLEKVDKDGKFFVKEVTDKAVLDVLAKNIKLD